MPKLKEAGVVLSSAVMPKLIYGDEVLTTLLTDEYLPAPPFIATGIGDD